MQFAICSVAAAAVRKEPNHRCEMVNQLLFGETIQVLEEKEEWRKIKSIYDGYEGWLTAHLICEIDEATAVQPLEYVAISMMNTVQTPGGLIHVTMGSQLTGYDPNKEYLWREDFEYCGSAKNLKDVFTGNSIIQFAREWLNAPYLWGGKTFLGVDCSGFVQTVYKVFGIKLKRDAWQQAEQGKRVENLSKAKEGDLAFFDNEEGRIIHVGIILEGSRIIHASGKVRIDSIDENGIVNSETGKRTHQLHSMKRYF